MAIFRRGSSLTGTSNAGGVGTNRDSGRIAGYGSMTAAVRDQQVRPTTMQFVAQTATHQWMYVYHSLQHDDHDHDEEKRTDVRSGKSEAELELDALYYWSYWQTQSIARFFLYCLVLMRFYVCLLCLCQSRLVGDIMLSSCQPVYSSVCPTSVRPFVRLLWTWYFENEWTDFDANWQKWSVGKYMKRGQEVKDQGHRSPKLDLEAWQVHHSRSSWVE